MIGRGHDDGINVFAVEHLAAVRILFGTATPATFAASSRRTSQTSRRQLPSQLHQSCSAPASAYFPRPPVAKNTQTNSLIWLRRFGWPKLPLSREHRSSEKPFEKSLPFDTSLVQVCPSATIEWNFTASPVRLALVAAMPSISSQGSISNSHTRSLGPRFPVLIVQSP